jgi:hypothetical protein
MTYSIKPKAEGLYQITDNQLLIDNYKKLGDVLSELPDGIIDKGSTGIGATTCEIMAPRNSIIVVPTKALAYSKCEKHPECFYVGSPYLNIKSTRTATQINEYIRKAPGYKKIIVVADSLSKVIKAIGQSVYEDYFLMIDEIDSFQSEVHYRPRLEESIDYFFDFKHGCIISATIRDFSDQRFRILPHYSINFLKNEKQKLTVYQTNADSISILKYFIKEYDEHFTYLDANPGEVPKVLVALNSVELIMKTIAVLPPIYQKDCKILCSEKSSEKTFIGGVNYYAELNHGELPGQFNFITSAYFVGLDINETFYPILVNDSYTPYSLLSVEKTKQIIGRCRVNKQVPIFIYATNKIYRQELNNQELIEKAESQVQGVSFLIKSRHKENLVGEKLTKAVESLFDSWEDIPLIKISKDDKIEISYLNIDCEQIQQDVKNGLYKSYEKFKQEFKNKGFELAERNVILEEDYDAQKILDYVKEKEAKSEEVKLKFISEIRKSGDLSELSKFRNGLTGEKLWNYYCELAWYFSPEDIAKILEDKYVGKRNTKEIDSYMRSYKYFRLNPADPWKVEIEKEFPIGSSFTSDEIFAKMKKIESRYGTYDKSIGSIKTRTRATNLLKELRVLSERKQKRNNNKKDNLRFIENKIDNMFGFVTLKEIWDDFEPDEFMPNLDKLGDDSPNFEPGDEVDKTYNPDSITI